MHGSEADIIPTSRPVVTVESGWAVSGLAELYNPLQKEAATEAFPSLNRVPLLLIADYSFLTAFGAMLNRSKWFVIRLS